MLPEAVPVLTADCVLTEKLEARLVPPAPDVTVTFLPIAAMLLSKSTVAELITTASVEVNKPSRSKVPVPVAAWLKPLELKALEIVTLFAALMVTRPKGVVPPTARSKAILPDPAVRVRA